MKIDPKSGLWVVVGAAIAAIAGYLSGVHESNIQMRATIVAGLVPSLSHHKEKHRATAITALHAMYPKDGYEFALANLCMLIPSAEPEEKEWRRDRYIAHKILGSETEVDCDRWLKEQREKGGHPD